MVQADDDKDIKPFFDDTKVAFHLKNDRELKRAYWLFKALSYPVLATIGLPMVNLLLKLNLPIKRMIRSTVFKHFCGGETIESCNVTIAQLGWANIGTILDYSVESGHNNTSFDHTCQEVIRTIHRAAGDPSIPFAVIKVTALCPFHLLERASTADGLSANDAAAFDRFKNRLDNICKTAYDCHVRLLIDAEHSWIQDVVDRMALQYMAMYNREKPIIYNTYQLYRHDKLAALKNDFKQARESGFHLGVKLVRGAYMELERKRAATKKYPSPIHTAKEAVDTDFDDASKFCLANIAHIGLVSGTHNEISCGRTLKKMNELGIPNDHSHIYFSQLLGMSDHISFNLANAGYNVAKYVPYGPIMAVMPYLFRRVQENTAVSNQSGRELSLITKEIRRRKTEAQFH